MGMTELLHHLRCNNTGIQGAHLILFAAYKLMARVNIAISSNAIVFMTGAAASQTLSNTRTIIKCYIKMEEVKGITFTTTLQICTRQLIVFIENYRQIFLGQYPRFINAYYGLYGNLLANLSHIQHILTEMGAEMGIGSAQIVVFALTAVNYLLKAAYSCIIAAGFIRERTHSIMSFLLAIQAQYQHNTVIIEEFDIIIIQKSTVSCQSQFNILAGFFFATAYIFCNMNNNRPVHQRFTAEHIQLPAMALLAAFNSKLDSLFRSFLAHELTAATKRTGVSKTVTATQIAVMSYKQAQGFYNRLFCKSRGTSKEWLKSRPSSCRPCISSNASRKSSSLYLSFKAAIASASLLPS